jgi:hypothetical protein
MKPTLIEELNNKIQAHKSTMQEEKKLKFSHKTQGIIAKMIDFLIKKVQVVHTSSIATRGCVSQKGTQ